MWINNPRMDKLKAMKIFVQIADDGSLTAAAASLGASLPSVVRSLAALEADLGARLFQRTTRRVALTQEGLHYLGRCRDVLGAIFDFNGMLWCHALALFAAFASRRLKVGAAVGRWLNRTMGALFVALGVKLALASR